MGVGVEDEGAGGGGGGGGGWVTNVFDSMISSGNSVASEMLSEIRTRLNLRQRH